MNRHIGHTTLKMGRGRSLISLCVDEVHSIACHTIESIRIAGLWRDSDIVLRLINHYKRLENIAHPILHLLAQGVQVRRKNHRSGENALAVLAFAFSEKLFPPFGDVKHIRVERRQHFNHLLLFVQEIPTGRVLIGRVLFKIGARIFFLSFARALHQTLDVDPGNRQRHQSRRRQD